MTGIRLVPIRLKAAAELERRKRLAAAGVLDAHQPRGARSVARRDHLHRRGYAGDPWAYVSDILGIRLVPQQEEALALIEEHDRVLLPSGNNLGKTMLLACYGIYRFDAVAALPHPEMGLEEQGARILLPGPDADTVFHTIYAEMLALALRAEHRGHLMPGERSDKSVLWRGPAPKWNMEAFNPPQRVGQNVVSAASGRHHINQVALIEEGQGVAAPLWRATEGMCSSPGNKIASSFNPNEALGPAFERAQNGTYKVYTLGAFKHPNVQQRRDVIPEAVDFRKIDDRVRSECRDRGPYPATPLDPNYHDFVYALPPVGADGQQAPERGPRDDGFPGHPDGQLRVYRPGSVFVPQVLGMYPRESETSLFDPAKWDAAVGRWKATPDPRTAPDRVGVDVAREGGDDTASAPAWGQGAGSLLRAYAAVEVHGLPAVQALQVRGRARVGEIRIHPKGKGTEVGDHLARTYPGSPLTLDEGGVGTSPHDYLKRVLRRDVLGVSFSETPPNALPGEPYAENLRAAMYIRAAMLVARDMVDVPEDPLLREEIMATEVRYSSRTVEVRPNVKERVQTVLVIPKEDIKKKIGRSPNRADAFVLALHEAEQPRRRRSGRYTGQSTEN